MQHRPERDSWPGAVGSGGAGAGGSWVRAPFRIVEERLRLAAARQDEVRRAQEEQLERAVPRDRRRHLQLVRLVVEEVLDQLAAVRLVEFLRERVELADVGAQPGTCILQQL